MLKIVLLILSIFVFANASEYSRSNAAAKEAFKDLDCDFGDCPKPEVIIQERVIIKEVPVEIEKVIVKETIIYRDSPIEEVAPIPKAITGRNYNKAFFDVHTKTQAPMLDYISFTSRTSFNIEHFVDTLRRIKEYNTKVYIHGQIAVPNSINTSQVYINVGKNYYNKHYNQSKKAIYYNNSDIEQNSDYFLVDVKTNAHNERYVEYKIYLLLYSPWELKASEEKFAPNTFFFKMAPRVRGFKDKFVNAEIYIDEE